jgi:hypothetical protein
MIARTLLTSILLGLASHAAAAADPPSKRMADGREWTTKNADVEKLSAFAVRCVRD